MSITWAVYLDDDDDAVFAEAAEAISADVVRFEAFCGFENFFDRMAAPSRAQVTVQDTGIFSPEHVSVGDIKIGRHLRIVGTYSAVDYTIYTGVVLAVRPNSIRRLTVIELVGRSYFLDTRIRFEVMKAVTADQVIDVALARAGIRERLYISGTPQYGRWQLNHATRGKLDNNVLSSEYYDANLDTGVSTFDYVGDEYETVTARRIVQDAAVAEYGRFYDDVSGTLRFLNRHNELKLRTSAVTLSKAVGYEYAYGEHVYNSIEIAQKAVYITPAATLWQTQAALRFGDGLQIKRVKFRDDVGDPRGLDGELSTYPQTLYDSETGGGVVSQATASIRVVPDGTGAEIVVLNEHEMPLWVQAGASMIGDAIDHDPPQVLVQRDLGSIADYGERVLSFPLPSFAGQALAENLATWLAQRFAEPLGVFRRLRLQNDAVTQLARSLFERVTVSLADVGHSGDHLVVGIRNIWEHGDLVTELILQPATGVDMWILGKSKLGLDTRLGV